MGCSLSEVSNIPGMPDPWDDSSLYGLYRNSTSKNNSLFAFPDNDHAPFILTLCNNMIRGLSRENGVFHGQGQKIKNLFSLAHGLCSNTYFASQPKMQPSVKDEHGEFDMETIRQHFFKLILQILGSDQVKVFCSFIPFI